MPSRPTTVAGIRERLARFRSEQSLARGLAIAVRPDDFFICTYPKCGTTWAQQIVHALRTGGDMDFAEITEVVPWLEMAHDLGVDPDAGQRGSPRAFKTHLAADALPPGGRTLCIVREPGAVLRSFYHFFEGWLFEAASIDFQTFAMEFFAEGSGSGRYWTHLLHAWARLGREDTLILAYEDLRADLPGAVARINRFMGLPGDAERLATAVRLAGFEYMRAHERQFDDHLVRRVVDPLLDLPAGGKTTKVRSAGHGDTMVPAPVQALLDDCWREEVAPMTGCADYAVLRRALAAARQQA